MSVILGIWMVSVGVSRTSTKVFREAEARAIKILREKGFEAKPVRSAWELGWEL